MIDPKAIKGAADSGRGGYLRYIFRLWLARGRPMGYGLALMLRETAGFGQLVGPQTGRGDVAGKGFARKSFAFLSCVLLLSACGGATVSKQAEWPPLAKKWYDRAA
jgi:hypothetical protein